MIVREITAAWTFFREQGFQKTLLAREAPFLIQFGKYGVCGVISVIVFLLVVSLCRAITPAYFSPDLAGSERAFNNFIVHLIAFLPSNFTAYALNRWLVFTPGRHSAKKEMLLFTLISFLSFSIGEFFPSWLVVKYNVPNYIADLSFIISSTMVNFVCRKFFVFEK